MSQRNPLEGERLCKLLVSYFSVEQMRGLCLGLKAIGVIVDFEKLVGEGLDGKARELVEQLDREGQLSRLAEAMQLIRPELAILASTALANLRKPRHTKYAHILCVSVRAGHEIKAVVGTEAAPDGETKHIEDRLGEVTAVVGAVNADERYRRCPVTWETSDESLLIWSLEAPDAVLECALKIAAMEGNAGPTVVRMGLHSEPVYPDPDDDSEPRPPAYCLKIANTLGEVCAGGQVLASSSAADFARTFPAFASLVHPAGKCDLGFGGQENIYNIYGASIGNPESPKPRRQGRRIAWVALGKRWVAFFRHYQAGPSRTVLGVRIPPRVRIGDRARIQFVFPPAVSYVRVEFAFNLEVLITGANPVGRGNAFEYDFAQGLDSRKQSFDIAVDASQNDSIRLLKILCRDENGQMIAPVMSPFIKLQRKPDPPDKVYDVVKLAIWLWDRFVHAKWYVKYVLPPITVALFAVLAPVLIPEGSQRWIVNKWEDLMVKTVWPDRIDKWVDEIRFTRDGAWEQAGEWDYPGLWRLVPGDAGGRDAALLMDGEGLAVHKELGSRAFYDFQMEFKLQFCQGTKSAWVLRVSPDRQRYYLFELEKQGSRLLLRGFSYSATMGQERLDDDHVIPIPGGLNDSDRSFRVVGIIRGYEFGYRVAPENGAPDDTRQIFSRLFPEDREEVIKAKKNFYRYGNVGVLGTEGQQTQLFYWRIKPIQDTSSGL